MIYIGFKKDKTVRYLSLNGNTYEVVDVWINEIGHLIRDCAFKIKTDTNECEQFYFKNLNYSRSGSSSLKFFGIASKKQSIYFILSMHEHMDYDFLEWLGGEGMKIRDIMVKDLKITQKKIDIQQDFI